MALIDTIKRISSGAQEAGNPVMVVYGTVTSLQPLVIDIEQRLSVSADFLVVPAHLTPYKLRIGAGDYTIREGLQTGDRVILVRAQGGQEYIVLDKVADADALLNPLQVEVVLP